MHYSLWLTLASSASVFARPEGVVDRVGRLNVRDLQNSRNLPALKSTLETLTKDGDALDKAIAALTKENAATQVDVITKTLNQLSADTVASAAKIGKSGAVGALEVAGLLSAKNQEPWKVLGKEVQRIVNQTSMDIMAKKEITSALPEAKLAGLAKAIKGQKKGIIDMATVLDGQVPASVKTQIESFLAKQAANAPKNADGTSAPPPKMPKINDPEIQSQLNKVVDDLLDQVVNIVSGKQEKLTMPAGIPLPPGVAPPGAAPPGAAASSGAAGASGAAGTAGTAGTADTSAAAGSADTAAAAGSADTSAAAGSADTSAAAGSAGTAGTAGSDSAAGTTDAAAAPPPKAVPKGVPKGEPKSVPKGEPKSVPKTPPKDAPKGSLKGVPKTPAKGKPPGVYDDEMAI